MNQLEAETLALQRSYLQQKIRIHRTQYVNDSFDSNRKDVHFPRSATMQFITGKAGLKVVSKVTLRFLVKLAMRRIFAKILISEDTKKVNPSSEQVGVTPHRANPLPMLL